MDVAVTVSQMSGWQVRITLYTKKSLFSQQAEEAWLDRPERVEPGRPLQLMRTHHHQYVAVPAVMRLRDLMGVNWVEPTRGRTRCQTTEGSPLLDRPPLLRYNGDT
jgi:hypothetical protein